MSKSYHELLNVYCKGRTSPIEAANFIESLQDHVSRVTMDEVESALIFLTEERDKEYPPTLKEMKSAIYTVRARANQEDAPSMQKTGCRFCSDTGWMQYLEGLPDPEIANVTVGEHTVLACKYSPRATSTNCPCIKCPSGKYIMSLESNQHWLSGKHDDHMQNVARWKSEQPPE